MIARVTGRLVEVDEGRVVLDLRGSDGIGVCRELLVPAIVAQELESSVGQTLTLETLEYLESVGQGASFIPRLVGFTTPQQREFFEMLTKVKGLGNRRALRAFARPLDEMAGAILASDTKALSRLPEIGKRLAETIVLDLKGKVGSFVGEDGGAAPEPATTPPGGAAEQAVEALQRLGETRADAETLVSRVIQGAEEQRTADEILSAALEHRD